MCMETTDPEERPIERIRSLRNRVNGVRESVEWMEEQGMDTDYQRGQLDAYENVLAMMEQELEEMEGEE